MRQTGIDVLGEAPWGTHFCQFYHTAQDLVDVLVPYFRQGLQQNEFCMWITSEPLGHEEARAALRRAAPDLEGRLRRGQMEILPYDRWYTSSGKFEADRVLSGWIEKEEAALRRGYEGLRLTGNTFWLEENDWPEFCQYEAAVNDAIGTRRMMALCTYCLDKCGAVELMDVVSNHQFALIKQAGAWRIIESEQHRKTEAALRRAHGALGLEVQERTADLAHAAQALEIEARRRMAAQEVLREQSRVLEAFFTDTVNPLVFLDRQFNFLRVNQAYAKACQRQVAEFPGHNHFELYPHAENEAIFREVVRSRTPFRAVAKPFCYPDHPEWGTTYWDWTLVPILDAAGEVEFLVFSLKDVTEHKRAEERLQAMNADLQRRAEQLRALAAELTRAEQRERRRLARVLHDHLQQLLFAARLSLGSLTCRAREPELQPFLRQVDELLRESLQASRSLTVDLSPPVLYDAGLTRTLQWLAQHMQEAYGLTVEVQADPQIEEPNEDVRVLLFQAVRELLFNVVKHAGVPRALVRLRMADSRHVEITVADRGVGFDAAPLQPDGAYTGGLGLSGMRERLELCGGRMEVDSAPGEGTRVAIRAPCPQAPPRCPGDEAGPSEPPADLSPESRRRPPRAGKIRVLVADDHQVLREGLARLLREQPDLTLVGEAENGRQAVDLALRTQPDVVVMDVTMPVLNGIDATRRIVTAMPRVRVIGLSMHEEPDMAAAMLAAGAAAYLPKGGSSGPLIDAIRGRVSSEGDDHDQPG